MVNSLSMFGMWVNRRGRVCLAGLLACAIFCGAQTPDVVSDAYLQRLRAAVGEAQRGDIASAMADVKGAVTLDPNRADGWYQLGSLLGQTGDFPGAESALRRAIQLKPDLAKAHFSLALTLIANPQNKLDWPAAIAECREALKYQPDYAEALNLLGAGLASEGKTDEAIAALEQSLQSAPGLAEAHFNLGLAFESAGQLESAAKEYRAAVVDKGEYPEATSALAKLLLRTDKADEAEQELNAALCLNPDLTDAHYTLARVLRALHREKEAAVEFAEAKELTERQPNATQSSQVSNQGLELAAKGNMAGAEAALRKAITLKPDYGVPHYNLGLILADLGNTAGAVDELGKAISLMPGQARPWFDLGRVLRRAKDDRALAALTWAAHLSPSDAKIAAELSSLRGPLPVPEAGSEVRPPNVGAWSDLPDSHLAFAKDLLTHGDFQGAAGELLRVLALRPPDVTARRSLAEAYAHLGDEGRAILEFQKVVRCTPADGPLHLSLGKLLLATGDREAALEQFRLAIQSLPDLPEAREALERAIRPPAKP